MRKGENVEIVKERWDLHLKFENLVSSNQQRDESVTERGIG